MSARLGLGGMDALEFLAQRFDIAFRQRILDNEKSLLVELLLLFCSYGSGLYTQYMKCLFGIHDSILPTQPR